VNEAKRTTTILAKVRTRWPSAWVWKVNDRITSGIPDAEIVIAGRTFRIEFKLLPSTTALIEREITEIQKMTMRALRSAHAHVAVVGVLPTGAERIYEPQLIDRDLRFPSHPALSLVAYLESELTCSQLPSATVTSGSAT